MSPGRSPTSCVSFSRIVATPALLILALAGCLSTQGEEIRHYDLRPSLPAAEATPGSLWLRVDPISVRGGRDRLEFTVRTETGSRLAWRAFHRWVRRPCELVNQVLLDGLRKQGAFVAVETSGLMDGPGLVLSGELVSFEQVYAGPEFSGRSRVLVELEATLAGASPELEQEVQRFTAAASIEVGSKDGEGDRSDVAVAMEDALEQTMAGLLRQVAERSQVFRRRPPESVVSQKAVLDLRLNPTAAPALPAGLSLRVNRLRAEGGLDRLELLNRPVRHQLEVDHRLSWQRRPTEVLLDVLVAQLRDAGATVLRPAQPGTADADLDGYLRRFELAESEGETQAVVEVEMTFGPAVRTFFGKSRLSARDPDQVASAFETAIGMALEGVHGLVTSGLEMSLTSEQPGAPAPGQRFLTVEATLPPRLSKPFPGSIRVTRLEIRPDLDRMEVILRSAEQSTEVLSEFHWWRRPAQRVTSAIEDGLIAARGGSTEIGGPLDSGEFDFELRGQVTSYHLRLIGGVLYAEVSVRLELVPGPGVISEGMAPPARRHLIVSTASAEISELEASAIAIGMGQALSALLLDVTGQLHEVGEAWQGRNQ